MQRKLAEIMQEMGVGAVRENYSGRGMNGRATTGLVVSDLTEFATALFDFSDVIQEAKESGDLDDRLTHFATDNMGRDMIIY